MVYLRDPVRLPKHHATRADKAAARLRLRVPASRKLFLFFGDVSGRKGLWELIDSLGALTIEEMQLTCLAIVGQAEPHVERRLAPRLERLAAATPLSIMRRAAYVDEAELGDWFTAADVVLAPYIQHVGTSNILFLAAAYRRPVISQDFGLMARLTRDYRLGLTVNPSDPSALAGAMRSFLGETPPPVFDPEVAYALAKRACNTRNLLTLFSKSSGPISVREPQALSRRAGTVSNNEAIVFGICDRSLPVSRRKQGKDRSADANLPKAMRPTLGQRRTLSGPKNSRAAEAGARMICVSRRPEGCGSRTARIGKPEESRSGAISFR